MRSGWYREPWSKRKAHYYDGRSLYSMCNERLRPHTVPEVDRPELYCKRCQRILERCERRALEELRRIRRALGKPAGFAVIDDGREKQ